ncbi:polysaccharide pyruvyl transferase family protein [Patescibacteria group bacterium]|nr:polysaccharide pyruvyl transferase family protein [Patescibacteria group bacterium]MBU4367632.1 polysaccharide pyruvyl transferase family protein [Patescibacteria group bacterium]MBU4462112.1 polysaccharide pyruvyl transferase family protein [Patescibacteria group bacterium]MCG2700431.1 polysaccharide pyruvyl transferase family protein [Candidatus Parcubacteria bacterium]
MKTDFFNINLDNSLLIGFYGGGNLGDELILEVLMNLFKERGYKNIDFYYSNPGFYNIFHHDFGYKMIDAKKRTDLFISLLRAKNIVIGGGGLWGLDFNKSIFFLSLILFFSRFILGKKVYLVGVGYYNSATYFGRIGAFFAGMASNVILARDQESRKNFRFFQKKTLLKEDISFLLPDLNLGAYKEETDSLDKLLHLSEISVFISVRRFQKKYSNNYLQIILGVIRNNPNKSFILATFEPREIDPEGYALCFELSKNNKNVQYLEFRYNPVALYLYLKINKDKLITITPQYHGILLAYMAGCDFFPLSYDNKCRELLMVISKIKNIINIYNLTVQDLQKFIDEKDYSKNI